MSNIYDALTKANKPPKPLGSLSVSLRGMSLEWKIMLLVLGLLFVVILNQLMGGRCGPKWTRTQLSWPPI